jgi:hypothetical protein
MVEEGLFSSELGHFGLLLQLVQGTAIGENNRDLSLKLSPPWRHNAHTLKDISNRNQRLNTEGTWFSPLNHVVIVDPTRSMERRQKFSSPPEGFRMIDIAPIEDGPSSIRDAHETSEKTPGPQETGPAPKMKESPRVTFTNIQTEPTTSDSGKTTTGYSEEPPIPPDPTTSKSQNTIGNQSVNSSITMSSAMVTEAPGGYKILGYMFFRKSVKPADAYNTIGFRRCISFEPRISDFTEAEQAPFLDHETIIANLNSKFIEYTSACDQDISDEAIIEQGFEFDYLGIRQWPMVQTCPVFTVPELFNHFIKFHKDCFAREGVLGLQNFLVGDRVLWTTSYMDLSFKKP